MRGPRSRRPASDGDNGRKEQCKKAIKKELKKNGVSKAERNDLLKARRLDDDAELRAVCPEFKGCRNWPTDPATVSDVAPPPAIRPEIPELV